MKRNSPATPMTYFRTVSTTCALITALATAGTQAWRINYAGSVDATSALAASTSTDTSARSAHASAKAQAIPKEEDVAAPAKEAQATSAAEEVPSEDASKEDGQGPAEQEDASASISATTKDDDKTAAKTKSDAKDEAKDSKNTTADKSEDKAKDSAQASDKDQDTEAQEEAKASDEAAAAAEEEALAEEAANHDDAVEAEEIDHPAAYIWDCGADYGGIAPDDGSLSEWAPHYYVAHSYGTYGSIILGLEPGDRVIINGTEVTIEGSIVMPLYTYYEDIMDIVGWDATVFQTCVPDSNDCRYVYARGESSNEEAAEEARSWAGIGEHAAGKRPEGDFETRAATHDIFGFEGRGHDAMPEPMVEEIPEPLLMFE